MRTAPHRGHSAPPVALLREAETRLWLKQRPVPDWTLVGAGGRGWGTPDRGAVNAQTRGKIRTWEGGVTRTFPSGIRMGTQWRECQVRLEGSHEDPGKGTATLTVALGVKLYYSASEGGEKFLVPWDDWAVGDGNSREQRSLALLPPECIRSQRSLRSLHNWGLFLATEWLHFPFTFWKHPAITAHSHAPARAPTLQISFPRIARSTHWSTEVQRPSKQLQQYCGYAPRSEFPSQPSAAITILGIRFRSRNYESCLFVL